MNNEDFCTYEIARMLKAMGFDWPCSHYYTKENAVDDEVWITPSAFSLKDWNNGRNAEPDFLKPLCSAPTLYSAQKWLREIIGIHVGVTPVIQIRKWQFYLDDLTQHINPHDGEMLTRCTEEMQDEYDEEYFDTYESALSAGIVAALKLIEEGEG